MKKMTSEFVIGVHALVYLQHIDKSVSSEVLAENICTNPVSIRRVLSKLKRAGMVETKEGLKGGYRIVEKGGEISLDDICKALEMDVIKTMWKSGNPQMECMIASGMSMVMDEISDGLNNVCNQYLKRITIKKLEDYLEEKAEKPVV